MSTIADAGRSHVKLRSQTNDRTRLACAARARATWSVLDGARLVTPSELGAAGVVTRTGAHRFVQKFDDDDLVVEITARKGADQPTRVAAHGWQRAPRIGS